MTTPHKWADVLRAIADGKEVEHERTSKIGTWVTPAVGTNPISCPHLNWRIKPEMVRVGRHSWPMPLREAPLRHTEYWLASPVDASRSKWDDDDADFKRINSGMIHLTKEAAEQHAAALRCINRGDVE